MYFFALHCTKTPEYSIQEKQFETRQYTCTIFEFPIFWTVNFKAQRSAELCYHNIPIMPSKQAKKHWSRLFNSCCNLKVSTQNKWSVCNVFFNEEIISQPCPSFDHSGGTTVHSKTELSCRLFHKSYTTESMATKGLYVVPSILKAWLRPYSLALRAIFFDMHLYFWSYVLFTFFAQRSH